MTQDPNNPSGAYQPNQQDWDRASNDINAWKDKNAAGQNINWDAARKAFEQRASTGQGNYGDWVNSTLDQSKNWLSGGTPAPAAGTPASGGQNAFDLEKFRQSWYGKGDVNNVQGWLDQNRSFTDGVQLVNGHKAYRNGQFIADLVGNAHNPNQAKTAIFLDGIGSNGKPRTPKTPPKPKGPGISPPGPGNLPPGGPTPPTTPPTTPPGAAGPGQSVAPIRDPRLDALYNTLMARANQGLTVGRDDPAVRGQADAYSAQQTRSQRDHMADLAESSGPNANLRGEARLAAERAGQASGAFEAQLMGREIQSRRDEITAALNNSQGLLTTEQQLALQQKLHMLDDATRRLGLNQQDKQYYAGLKQSDKHFGADLDYRNRALDQNDAQFRDRLGFDYADRSNYWDSIYRGAV